MRTEGDFIKINEWLLPLSWLYGIGVRLRNWMFDIGVLKSQSYDIPIIAVGNITVGGSGKTPHVEYLVNLLHNKLKVGVLSRGYKRKSHGYQLANADTPMRLIGDEPYQMRHKFNDIYVAVDKNRRNGIHRLTSDDATKDVDVILLDDAYQHRYVKPGINILLVDYHRLIIYDKLLPAGRMREPQEGKSRADIVIVTKCPKDLTPLTFGDHHQFTADDIERVNSTFAAMKAPKIIITTEKDSTRLTNVEGLSQEAKNSIYALPIRIKFMLEGEEEFNNKITSYVRKNSRNSILVKRKDDNKS